MRERPGLGECPREPDYALHAREAQAAVIDSAALEELMHQQEGTREQRVFCNWINSLGPEQEMTDLLEDSKSGVRLLEVITFRPPARARVCAAHTRSTHTCM